MKFIRWAGLVLLSLLFLFVVAYLIMPATRYETRVEVDRPVDVAWRVFADESRMGEWLTAFRSLETISGKPQTVGSRHRLVFEEDGQEIVFEEEVLAWQPEEKFAFRMTHPMMTGEYVIEFESLGERTAITVAATVQGRGVLKPLMPLMRGSMIERATGDYERLKALIEAEPEESPAVPAEEEGDATKSAA